MDHFLTTSATITLHHRHRPVFVVGISVQGHANKAWQVRTQAGWGRKEEGLGRQSGAHSHTTQAQDSEESER